MKLLPSSNSKKVIKCTVKDGFCKSGHICISSVCYVVGMVLCVQYNLCIGI